MKYTITYTKAFKKDFKKLSPKDQEHTLEILTRLANGESLEPKYKDHALKGEYANCRDCHIRPDLVLLKPRCSYRYIRSSFLNSQYAILSLWLESKTMACPSLAV